MIPPDRGHAADDDQPRPLADEQPLERTELDDQTPGRPADEKHTLELRQEELVPHKQTREVGEARIRTWVQEVPGRLEVDAYSEEVEVEHVPLGQVVSERKPPWQEDDVLIVPIYEEQLVVSKRLVMREQLRIRRVGTHRRELFEDTLRRERVEVEDPQSTGLVHERHQTHAEGGEDVAQTAGSEHGNVLEHLVHKALH